MSLELSGPLVLVGAGKMGGALLEGWLAHGVDPARVLVLDPAPSPATAELLSRHKIARPANAADLPRSPAVVVLAVKPQTMDGLLPSLAPSVGPSTLVLSIAAGRTIASFERQLPAGAAIVRAMPNTPAAIGQGITVATANGRVDAGQRELAGALLAAVGEVAWVDDEGLMDAVTAVSGSGPAYVFLLAECLAEAGVAAGLDKELAARLAAATVVGSAGLLAVSGEAPSNLREKVTSPGGTTQAALEVLKGAGGAEGLAGLLRRAVKAATDRSRELAK